MPTVILNKKVLEKLMEKKLPLEQLKDRISMLGTDLEKIEGNEIHVEIFPNRPDMLSEQGFARALSSFIGVKTGMRKYDIKKSGYQVIVDKNVSMRPYTACAIVKNIKFDDEKIRQIMQIQEKLAATHGRNRKKSAYGLYPIKDITFPIHYIAKDPTKIKFKPLGFDQEMTAIKVETVHPKGKEYKFVAEGWKEYPFFIDSKDKVMCMLPYTNSEDTGKVDETTKEVFIECTGVDFMNVNQALSIFVTMLSEMGGDVYSMDIVYHDKTITTPDMTPQKMKLDIEYAKKLLGIDLTEKDVKKYLERMGHEYDKRTVLIPSYRVDIMHQIDIVEEIAIAYGYENFEGIIPNITTTGEEDPFEVFKRRVANILAGAGLIECFTYHLTSPENQNMLMNTKYKLIELESSASQEYNVLRTWMVPSMLEVLKNNKHHDYPQNIFDIGTTFKEDSDEETNVHEDDKLCVMLCNDEVDFTRIKQILDYLMNSIDVKYYIKETEHASFIKGRAGDIHVDNKTIGVIGEINPEVLTNWTLEMPVSCFEINLSKLFGLKK